MAESPFNLVPKVEQDLSNAEAKVRQLEVELISAWKSHEVAFLVGSVFLVGVLVAHLFGI